MKWRVTNPNGAELGSRIFNRGEIFELDLNLVGPIRDRIEPLEPIVEAKVVPSQPVPLEEKSKGKEK